MPRQASRQQMSPRQRLHHGWRQVPRKRLQESAAVGCTSRYCTLPGQLTAAAESAWRALARDAGEQWASIVAALRDAPPTDPHALARLIRTIADLDVPHSGFGYRAGADEGVAVVLEALPTAPLPLPCALPLCAGPDGYIPAATQAALLESYGGVRCASAAHALALDLQASFRRDGAVAGGRLRQHHLGSPCSAPACGGAVRAAGAGHAGVEGDRAGAEASSTSGPARVLATRPSPSSAQTTTARAVRKGSHTHTQPAAMATSPAQAVTPEQWAALDGVDLADELRHPVPTIQEVPPFLRGALRGALVQALGALQAASGADCCSPAASRAWKLFLLAPAHASRPLAGART